MLMAAKAAVAISAVVVCVLFGLAVAAGDPLSIPVGVAPSDAGFYQIGKEFQCRDGSLKIKYSQVNDDYCDCPDGSDEPGTSACSPLGKFYCKNKGFRGEFIPSSQVDDGICDCCDGSDEQPGTCINTCIEKGRHLQEERRAEIEKHLKGSEKKEQYQAEAVKQISEKEAERHSLKAKLEELENKLKPLEEKKNLLKEDKDLADRINNAEKKQKEKEESKEEEEEKNEHVESSEEDIIVDNEEEPEDDDALEGDDYQHDGEDDEKAWEEEDQKYNKATEENSEQKESSEEPPEDIAELKKRLEERGKVVSDVIKEYDDLDNEIRSLNNERRDVERDLSNLEKELDKDFGPSNEFYYLQHKCVEWKTVEYTYKVCPFKDARQDHTELGRWEGWENDYTAMKFTNGQKCWGGPNRSLDVKVVCGSDDVLRDVEEPSRCAYTAVFETPALCSKEHAVALQLSFDSDFEVEDVPFV